jgi:hypothetical protein
MHVSTSQISILDAASVVHIPLTQTQLLWIVSMHFLALDALLRAAATKLVTEKFRTSSRMECNRNFYMIHDQEPDLREPVFRQM